MAFGRRGILAAGALAATPAHAQPRQSRLSAAVAFMPDSAALDAFLAAPATAAIEAHLRFEAAASSARSWRAAGCAAPSTRAGGAPQVRFDDVALEASGPGRPAALLFRDGFERQAVVPPQPPPGPLIRLDGYERGRWYREREEAVFRPEMVSFARSGRRVGVADARLD